MICLIVCDHTALFLGFNPLATLMIIGLYFKCRTSNSKVVIKWADGTAKMINGGFCLRISLMLVEIILGVLISFLLGKYLGLVREVNDLTSPLSTPHMKTS
jgi:hypothetical protein